MAFFEKEYTIDVSHVAPNGFITNMGILSLLEDTACKHSDVAGCGFNDINNTGLSWILLAWKVKILKRVKYADIIKVRTWSRPSKKFTTLRDFEILDKNDNIICIATTKWTLIDIKTGKISTITDEIIDKYFPEDKSIFSSDDNSDIKKLIEPKEHSSEYIYITQRRDIDVNKHMHNLNYLYLAYEALPEDVYNSPECNNLEIMYKTSIRLGDTVKCLYSKIDNAHYVTIKSLDNKQLHAIVKLY